MVTTGLSGNEMYCLNLVGYTPGDLLIGNSVYSMGLLGSVRAGFRGVVGGEITQYTQIVAEGRRLSFERLQKELVERGAQGATGVTSELIPQGSNIEFLSVASALHGPAMDKPFTSSSDGQELYCQMDSGYTPVHFVFGNVAYSIGIGQGLLGGLRSLGRGEVVEYSNIFTTTRNLALQRLVNEAKLYGANSVVGIETSILPFGGVQEMLMIGTASYNPTPSIVATGQVVTSDLTSEEMWNLTSLGYIPYKLLLGTSVYSLGLVGGITSVLRSFSKGEINELTTLIYDAREESIGKVKSEAEALGADDVVGIKTYVYQLGGGLIEFMAIGTAVKKVGAEVSTHTAQLPPQAIIRDRDSFFDTADFGGGIDLNGSSR